MDEARKSRKRLRRRLLLCCSVIALIASAVIALRVTSPSLDAVTLGKDGGTVWTSHGVGVRVSAGVVAQPTELIVGEGQPHPHAPADGLLDVIGGPVNIVPDHVIPADKADVMFKVPAYVPTGIACSDNDPHAPRSICNAGIEVYNPVLQGWVPLETRIEHGDTLVAVAPHFSEYRAVWTRLGEFTVNIGSTLKYTLTSLVTPDGLVAQTWLAYAKQLFENLTGHFDPEKMKPCEQHSAGDFTASFTKANPKVAACVIGQGSELKVLMQNGWVFPVGFTTDAKEGVEPVRYTESELTAMLRNQLAGLVAKGKTVFASGLDTAAFSIKDKAPTSFTVTSHLSWTGVAADLVAATFELFFPPGRVVEQIGKLIDTANCVTTGYQKIPGMALGDVPGQLAEILKGCMLRGVLQALRVNELVGALLKEAKILPELYQVGQSIAHFARTGEDIATSTFVVSRPLEALKGQWTYECGGSGDVIDFVADGSDSWLQVEYGPDNSATRYETFFHTELKDGKPWLIVDKTTLPGVKAKQRFVIRLVPAHDGFADSISIGENWIFYRPTGRSYC